MDPILLELYRHRFSGIAEEMGVTLRRTAFSPNIKERLDFSCALFDGAGTLIAQAAHIPVHLGAMPASVRAALNAFPAWASGDLAILNDPFAGGTHLPDITMVSPLFVGEEAPSFFLATRAHHADVGGMSPGSMPLSTELFQEGIIIPPLKLDEAGRTNEALLALILRNVRTPEERQGDLAAQRAAHATGERRLRELVERHGLAEVRAYGAHLCAYSERLTRAAIGAWPDGAYEAVDYLEWLDEGGALVLAPLRVRAEIAGDALSFDFAGSADALPTSLNAVLAITQSACWYAVRCLVGDAVPVNGGCFAPVEVRAPEGSVLHARPPAAVAGGNVETSQRVVDVVFAALARALPGEVAAAGQGTMNNLTIGGAHPDGSAFAYYETIGGGMGAHSRGDGRSGAHVHMSNTLNTPVEALERAFPFRLTRYALRVGSGGAGAQRGGDGVIREYEMLAPCTVTMLSERRALAPYGLAGGAAGAPGRNVLVRANGREEALPAKFTRRFAAGERLRVETPGGGGWRTERQKAKG